MPRPSRALSLSLVLAASIAAQSGYAAPPFPGKRGTQGPREGFSTARLRPDFAELPARGERITVETQATYQLLAIRVAFSDTPIDSSSTYYNRRLFFLNQYWNQVSDGQVTIVPTLWDSVFTLPHPMAYYGNDDRVQERLVFMIRDLVQLADSTVDFRPFQSLLVFHAGQGQEADVLDNSREQLWSAFLTPEDFKAILPDSTGAVGIRTNDAITPGNYYRIKEAVEVPEAESQDGYDFGTTGVTCHEFGHQLGLPDLYDTTTENGNSQGLGAWDIMATGVWNANGFVPSGPSAWSRSFLNWIVPTRIERDGGVMLEQLERPLVAPPIPPAGTSLGRIAQIPVTQSEYFLLENRHQDLNENGAFDFDDTNGNGFFDFYTDSYQGAEFDFFLPGAGTGSGVLAYHVDESKIAAGLLLNIVNGDRDRKGIDVVEADGVQDLDDPANGLNAGSPEDVFRPPVRTQWTPTTSPSTEAYGHVRTGISVTGITAPDSVINFNVAFDRVKPGWPVVLGGRVRNGGVPPLATDLDGDGALELLVPAQRLNNTGALFILEPDGSDFLDLDANPSTRDPFLTTTGGIVSTPCVGDVDGDGTVDIVVRSSSGSIYAMHVDHTEVLDGDLSPGTLGVFVPGSGTGTTAQPILADLNGDGTKEVVVGTPQGLLGASTIIAYRDSAGTLLQYSLPVGGASVQPAAAGDLNGDGLPEIVVAHRRTSSADLAVSGISILNWEMFNDPLLSTDPEDYAAYLVMPGTFSPPILGDLDRDGVPEIVVSDGTGSLHALKASFAPHIPGDLPSGYISLAELPGWPTPPLVSGALSEVSLGDLERDGHPEVFHTGGDCLVAGAHWSGSFRGGFPIATRDPLAPADSTGWWPPLIVDADGDGTLDVIAVLPDGRRPSYRPDAHPAGFTELGSTGTGSPPILADLDQDGTLEWIETYDQVPLDPRIRIEVRTTSAPASSLVWGQYRFGPTRDGLIPSGPLGSPAGTSILSQVYAYPNPSHSGSTSIHYRLSDPARSVRLKILDPSGKVIAEPPIQASNLVGSAEHSVSWNHAGLASGVYIARLEIDSQRGGLEVQFTKMAVVR